MNIKEVIVVIGIILVLVMLIYPAVQQAQQAAKNNEEITLEEYTELHKLVNKDGYKSQIKHALEDNKITRREYLLILESGKINPKVKLLDEVYK